MMTFALQLLFPGVAIPKAMYNKGGNDGWKQSAGLAFAGLTNTLICMIH